VGAGVCPQATLQIRVAAKRIVGWRMIPSDDINPVEVEMFRERRWFHDWLQK
jgi:hypothetical protein